MFTGIIAEIGAVEAVHDKGEKAFTIKTLRDLGPVAIGASIACDGCCLTVTEKTKDSFTVQVSKESLSRTTLGQWQEGSKVNLEFALRVGDELGGHIVSGHVDAVTRVESQETAGESTIFWLSVPVEYARFVAPKGSVTLDGVSLTVNEVKGNRFSVNIIPHTQLVTTLGLRKPGDRLNFEVDLIARYVARLFPQDDHDAIAHRRYN